MQCRHRKHSLETLVTGLLLAGTCGLASLSSAQNTPPGAPTGLLLDLMAHPLAVENPNPRFSWIVNDPDRSERQSAYQILVSGDNGVVWDSLRTESAESSNVLYAGAPLKPNQIYDWKVRTWDKEGLGSPYSEPQILATAVGDNWNATPVWNAPANRDDVAEFSDVTVELDFTIAENAIGVWLRHRDAGNTYLWQIKAGAQGSHLLPHLFKNGAHTILKTVPVEVRPGRKYRLKVEAEGSRFTTHIDGQQVDTLQDDTFSSGTIGFRMGRTERGNFANVLVTRGAESLLKADFKSGRDGFSGGRADGGALHLGRGESAVYGARGELPRFVMLRREFTLEDKPIARAIVHVTAVAPEPAAQYVYKLYLNESFVGTGPERGFAETRRYNSFDVTRLLRRGQANALAAINYSAHAERCFLLQLGVHYTDGTRQTIVTDENWKALPADTIYRDLGNAGFASYFYAPREGIDARRYPFGWKRAGFDDTLWPAAGRRPPIRGLKASATGNTELHTGRPRKFVKKGDGHFFIDFGESALAGIRLKVNGSDGHQLEIRVGEELSAPETVRKMRTGNSYEEIWTLKEGEQILENFGYRVFRYAEIFNAPAGFDASAIETLVYRHPFNDDAAHFSSSDPVLNDVWAFCKYSIKATSMDVYVDTHTRERRNYEGDALINQLSHYAVDREFALPRYSIEYLYYIPTWPTEYKLQSVIMAWNDYLYTGNPDSLRRHYEIIKTKTLESFVNGDFLVEKEPDAGGQNGPYGRDLVDWPVSQRDGYEFTRINTVINAFHCKAIENLGKIADVLGEQEDARRYQALASKLKEAINRHLYDPASGRFKDGRDSSHCAQHASAIPLALGVVDPALQGAAAEYAASRGMAMSVYGSQFLLEALYAAGRPQAALALMNAREGNSWGHMLYALDATIVGEAWDPSQKGNMSFSHAWASAPANIIPRGLFGIVPLKPGFEHFQIKPQPAGLDWAEITVPTIRGPIRAAFKRGPDTFELRVTIPANTAAAVHIPLEGQDGAVVRWNDQPVTGTAAGAHLTVPLAGSGEHRFVRSP
jgi:alpha-L-rhamnosidase